MAKKNTAKKFAIRRGDDRYLGASVWTYHIDKALRLSYADALKKAKAYSNVSLIPLTD